MKYCKVRDVKSPERGTPGSAGIDFFVPNDFVPASVWPQHDLLIPSGIKMNIPHGFMLLGIDKSGIATSFWACRRAGRTPKAGSFNSPVIIGAKLIDEDYQGEIHIHIINVGQEIIHIRPGMKIAQFVLVPVNYESLEETTEFLLFNEVTERGKGGFGSTD